MIADIPGLIPGASEGAGLGVCTFLKHIERTRVLLHLVSFDPGEGRNPLSDYLALRKSASLRQTPSPAASRSPRRSRVR